MMQLVKPFMKSIFIFVLGFSLLLSLEDIAIESRKYELSTVSIHPSQFLNAEDIRGLEQTVLMNLKSGEIAYDVWAIRQAFLEYPWVQDAAVKLIWSNGFEVKLKPHHPLAILLPYHSERTSLPTDHHEILLSNGNRIVASTGQYEQAFAALPRVYLEPAVIEHPIQNHLSELKQALDGSGLSLKGIDISKWNHWTVRLKDGSSIILGSSEFASRLKVLKNLLSIGVCHSQEKFNLDLRYKSAAALKCQTSV